MPALASPPHTSHGVTSGGEKLPDNAKSPKGFLRQSLGEFVAPWQLHPWIFSLIILVGTITAEAFVAINSEKLQQQTFSCEVSLQPSAEMTSETGPDFMGALKKHRDLVDNAMDDLDTRLSASMAARWIAADKLLSPLRAAKAVLDETPKGQNDTEKNLSARDIIWRAGRVCFEAYQRLDAKGQAGRSSAGNLLMGSRAPKTSSNSIEMAKLRIGEFNLDAEKLEKAFKEKSKFTQDELRKIAEDACMGSRFGATAALLASPEMPYGTGLASDIADFRKRLLSVALITGQLAGSFTEGENKVLLIHFNHSEQRRIDLLTNLLDGKSGSVEAQLADATKGNIQWQVDELLRLKQ